MTPIVPVEIERKYLVEPGCPALSGQGEDIVQGFFASADRTAVRVRLSDEGAWLTLKGATVGARRAEFEYAIPREEARQILDELCGGGVVVKQRYRYRHQGYLWEIDVFQGENAGLVIAEVELESEQDQPPRPAWVGIEVTGDPRYYNQNLARHPFSQWQTGED